MISCRTASLTCDKAQDLASRGWQLKKVLTDNASEFRAQEFEQAVRHSGANHVLVRVRAASVNPVDLFSLRPVQHFMRRVAAWRSARRGHASRGMLGPGGRPRGEAGDGTKYRRAELVVVLPLWNGVGGER
jgi:transposase InsO family protein